MTPPHAGDLKERLRREAGHDDHRGAGLVLRQAADHIESLETDLGGTAMAFEQYRNVTTDEMEALKSQLAEARKALEATGHERDRLRSGYGLIMNGLTEGRIKGDDVVWYDDILTLYDFCGDILGHEYGGKEEDRS